MPWLFLLIIACGALLLAIGLAYLPLRFLLTAMAKGIAAPIREFMQRQRDRRGMIRETPDRRKT